MELWLRVWLWTEGSNESSALLARCTSDQDISWGHEGVSCPAPIYMMIIISNGSKLNGRLKFDFGLFCGFEVMALRAGSAAVRRCPLTSLGALTVGLAAVNWRSIPYPSTRYLPPYNPLGLLRHQTFFTALTSTSMSPLTPPQPAPTWTHTADDVMRLTKEAIARDQEVQDKVAALAPEDCNMSSVSCLQSGASDD